MLKLINMEEKNLHEGHRSRMIERFIRNPAAASDHEILEIALYSVQKRCDTNALAHRLIRACGSLKNVLEADEDLLLSVNGMGKSSVAAIKVLSELAKRCYGTSALKERFVFAKYKDKLIDYFAGISTEVFVIFLLGGNGIIKTRLEYDGANDKVEIDVRELAKSIAVLKPAAAVLAHNHPSGNPKPSVADGVTTRKIASLLRVHGVRLSDHIIVAGSEVYSYFHEGEMDKINDELNKQGV